VGHEKSISKPRTEGQRPNAARRQAFGLWDVYDNSGKNKGARLNPRGFSTQKAAEEWAKKRSHKYDKLMKRSGKGPR
jgi:hypothetical protein